MPNTLARVVGSNFTTFNYKSMPIAYMDAFEDSGQAPIVGHEPVHPLGYRHPIEIATARAVSEGTLRLTIRELWKEPVWWQLGGGENDPEASLRGTWDIISVYEKLAADPSDVTCNMIIKPPSRTDPWRGTVYHGCVITRIDDRENVTIGALTFPRIIEIVYTHKIGFVGAVPVG